jgi:hypothetical protein
MYKLWSVYNVKENCPLSPFNILRTLYAFVDYAIPIEFYNGDKAHEAKLIVKEFYPDSEHPLGITSYALNKQQFDECFEIDGYWNDYFPIKEK